MNRARILRCLRISFTAACLLVGVLLIALWVRSYWWSDGFEGGIGDWYLEAESETGQCWVATYNSRHVTNWKLTTVRASTPQSRFTYGMDYQTGEWIVAFVPHWCLTVAAITCAFAPWLPWHFSLRTLLIAVTLLAVILGFITALV